MNGLRNILCVALVIATFAAGVAAPTPAAAGRCNRHGSVCPPLATAPIDLPLGVFIAAPAAPYSFYYAYPAPYPYVYASRGCIVRSGIYDGAGYFKGYQVLRVAC